MPRRKSKAAHRESVLEAIERAGLDPVQALVDVVRCEVRVSEEDLSGPVFSSLLADYEPLPSSDGSVRLRPRLARRIEALKTLLDFSRPRFRSHRVDGEIDHGITVVLKRFDPIPAREPVIIDSPIREPGMPAPVVDADWAALPRRAEPIEG